MGCVSDCFHFGKCRSWQKDQRVLSLKKGSAECGAMVLFWGVRHAVRFVAKLYIEITTIDSLAYVSE